MIKTTELSFSCRILYARRNTGNHRSGPRQNLPIRKMNIPRMYRYIFLFIGYVYTRKNCLFVLLHGLLIHCLLSGSPVDLTKLESDSVWRRYIELVVANQKSIARCCESLVSAYFSLL